VDRSQSLPTGVVTFLFTDVEGSTRLWEREPEAMSAALARHDAIMAAGIRQCHGVVVKSRGEGDSIFAVFGRARDAVAAALVIQRALGTQKWGTSTPLRVRMAIHTGHVDLRHQDYYGPTVNRCARLRALGHGGQVLLSGVSAQLVQQQLPIGASLKDLGTHHLKDLSTPEQVWQLSHQLLPSRFPLLKSPDVLSVGVPDPVEDQPLASDEVDDEQPEPVRILYKLTDQFNGTPDGRAWGENVVNMAPGTGDPGGDGDGWIRCYSSPKLAALLNAVNERIRQPRLWEAQVNDALSDAEGAVVSCRRVTTTRQVPLPRLTAQDYARFAVLCAREAYVSGLFASEFEAWSKVWLAGQDRSTENSRAIAETLETDAHRGGRLMYPETLAAAHAARSAVHAARTAFLGGRARDEETLRAAEIAAEAVHLSARVTRLDLVAIADRAVSDERLAEIAPPPPGLGWRVA
jgi:class 3 adenylate cyclase